MHRDFRKPLIVMSPKSLLRHSSAVSKLAEFTDAGFQEVLDDSEMNAKGSSIERVILCSGKVYYDLLAERISRKQAATAIVRVEQLYPWPAERVAAVLSRYKKCRRLVWVQEEPRNMGAWSYRFQLLGAAATTLSANASAAGPSSTSGATSARPRRSAPPRFTRKSRRPSSKRPSRVKKHMKHNVLAPSVGESITEVSILKWAKPDGAQVRVGELLLEIESDKATVEIVAETAGRAGRSSSHRASVSRSAS